ncbi:MAG: hypothetical protein ABIM98_04285 [candidate division WOR-3 bacterium]
MHLKKGNFKYLLFLSFIIYSCQKEEVIGEIEGRKIFRGELEDIMKIEFAYGNYGIKEEEAFLILVQKLIDVILAEKYGVVLSKEDILKEEVRIFKNTKEPSILSKIYESVSEKARRELFIKPLLARRILEETFLRDTLLFQRENYLKAKEYLKKLKSSKEIKDSNYFNFLPGVKSVIYEYISSKFLKKGEFKGEKKYVIFEDKFTYYPAEIKRVEKGFLIRGFYVNKKDFYKDFYFKELEKIKVLVYNKILKSKIFNIINKTLWEGVIK